MITPDNAVDAVAARCANGTSTRSDRDLLIMMCRPLIRGAADRAMKKYGPHGLLREDAIQDATLIVLDLAATYDPSRCASFIGYAHSLVPRRLVDAINETHFPIRTPAGTPAGGRMFRIEPKRADQKLGDEDDAAADPVDLLTPDDLGADAPKHLSVDEAADWRRFIEAIGRLNPDTAEVVLAIEAYEESPSAAGKRVGVGAAQARRMHRDGVASLKKKLGCA